MVVATHVFLIKENKVLLLRRYKTGYEDGKFSLPAGHLDGNESIRKATVREAKEEIGVLINEDDLAFASVFHRLAPGRESLDFFFTCKKWSGEPKVMEENKADQVLWSDSKNLPENTVHYIKDAVQAYLEGTQYKETTY